MKFIRIGQRFKVVSNVISVTPNGMKKLKDKTGTVIGTRVDDKHTLVTLRNRGRTYEIPAYALKAMKEGE